METACGIWVVISWNASAGATSYNLFRSTINGGEGTTPIATGITATTYTDTNLTNGTQYFYEVTAVNGNATYVPPLPSESAASNEVGATPSLVSNVFTANGDIGAPALAGSAKAGSENP